MVYIDFDGVILDTEYLLFKKWRENPNRYLLTIEDKIKYIKESNWEYILYNSQVINDSLYYLKQMDYNKTAILTKIHSVENEGVNKVKYLRENGVKQNIYLVPYANKKTDIVFSSENILVDDCLKNLDDWKSCGGYPIFFDKDNDNYDSWNEFNEKKYTKILDLSIFK